MSIGHLRAILVSLILVVLAPASFDAADQGQSGKAIRHDLKVILNPKEHRITAEDSITLPDISSSFRFLLHKGLAPPSPTPGVKIVRSAGNYGGGLAESYTMSLPPGIRTVKLTYDGKIFHPIESYGNEQAGGMRNTPGIISEEGVFLSGSSFWYPASSEDFVTFSLQVELPPGWDAVSQGERTHHAEGKEGVRVRWESPEPQDQIFLVAGRFTEYSKPAGRISAMAFLRTPDRELAGKYLDATARYLAMYEKLIGPYPYRKFALVENFWETGFGMPSFTLLGPKIIRFPFILDTSYPHEILHNWWGNSVFPDYARGNWSEGLTAYLSDYLMKEQQGSGAEYRETTLQKYTDYVSKEKDFPLTEFHSRHGSSSEAVGYGKALMFFHMLRQDLGDGVFVQALQDFYRANKFRLASFEDLQKSFSRVSGRDMSRDFAQWVARPGAPRLRVTGAAAKEERGGWVLSAQIEQVQPGEPYLLNVPVAVTMEGQGKAYQTRVTMNRGRIEMKLRLPQRPLRLDVDPEFDLFRRLDSDEVPPAFSQVLGAGKMLILLPSAAGKGLLAAYRTFAKGLSESGPDNVEILQDSEVKDLPADRAITILGWENRFFNAAGKALSLYEAVLDPKAVRIGNTELPGKNHSFVFAARNPRSRRMPLMLVACASAEPLPGLARKLPHYHKYSYLAFEGSEPVNVLKGRWRVPDSPMTLLVADDRGGFSRAAMGRLAPRAPLATLP